MRKTFVATAVAAVLSVGAFVSSSANAMTSAVPAGLRTAIDEAQPVEQVRHRCYRSGRGYLVCPRHRRVVAGYPYYGYAGYPYGGYGYGYGYPAVGIGLGYGWGGWGWGGSRTVVVRRGHHHHHHHRGHVRHRR